MFNLNFNSHSFSRYFDPKRNQTWKPVAKVGAGFIIVGLLILMLKELLIAVLAAGTIGVGIFILTVAFRIWRSNRDDIY